MLPPDSRTTRTTNRGGGVETNERVLFVARGGSRDRRWGPVAPVAAQRRSAGPERAAPGRGGGCVPRLCTGIRRRAGGGHGVFGLRVPVLRGGRGVADAGDPRAADRHGTAAGALPALSVALA